jgi:RNA polymerase primary sigma factor
MNQPQPPPRLLTFRDRLDDVLARALHSGSVQAIDYESLLIDPDFDERLFEQFRTAAAAAAVALPEESLESVEPLAASTDVPVGAEHDPLKFYLDEIGRIPLLAHPELLELARRTQAGDEHARRSIILANLRLVVYLSRTYRSRGLPILDLIEEGNLGLIQAVDRFEPERGLRFSTYAAICIRQSMLRGIAEQARSVRIPVQMFQQVNRFLRAQHTLRSRFGGDPTLEDIARELDISMARAGRLAGLVTGLQSLDEGPGIEAFDQLSAEDLGEMPMSVEQLVELQLQHEKIDRLLHSLGQREEQILRIRYGFHDGVSRTLAQTGEHFGITRERVRQIESRALAKLRQALEIHTFRSSPAA